jgi:hypothetical protein
MRAELASGTVGLRDGINTQDRKRRAKPSVIGNQGCLPLNAVVRPARSTYSKVRTRRFAQVTIQSSIL